jgi:hypothetical protein
MSINGIQRPFIDAFFLFPTLNNRVMDVQLLVDTGADGTRLSPSDTTRLARRFSVNLSNLPQGDPDTGIGGEAPTRVIPAVLLVGSFATPLALRILEPQAGPVHAILSLLGRDVLSSFAFFVEQRTSRVYLLEPNEADALALP